MSGISDSLVRHCPHAPFPAHQTARQRRRLRQLRHDPRLRPRERDRVEMCLLSAQGWTAPRLAVHLDVCAATVRRWIRQWEARGLKSMRAWAGPRRWRSASRCFAPCTAVCGPGYSGSASAAAHRAHVPAADGGQLPAHQVLSAAQTGTGGGGPRRVTGVYKKPAPAISSSCTWTKADSRPLCPPTYTWSRPGTGPHVPHENTQGRRVHVVAALAAPGTTMCSAGRCGLRWR